jgi:hypothetical protein
MLVVDPEKRKTAAEVTDAMKRICEEAEGYFSPSAKPSHDAGRKHRALDKILGK